MLDSLRESVLGISTQPTRDQPLSIPFTSQSPLEPIHHGHPPTSLHAQEITYNFPQAEVPRTVPPPGVRPSTPGTDSKVGLLQGLAGSRNPDPQSDPKIPDTEDKQNGHFPHLPIPSKQQQDVQSRSFLGQRDSQAQTFPISRPVLGTAGIAPETSSPFSTTLGRITGNEGAAIGPSSTASERAPPGKLAISTAVKQTNPSQLEKPAVTSTVEFPPLEKPAEPISIRPTQHVVRRIASTPKTEKSTSPSVPSAPQSASIAAASAIMSRQLSQQPSLGSMTFPVTPTSDAVSDVISYTSTSLSRANSPPPPKVGSAPVREKTKSKQKKERKENAKKEEQDRIGLENLPSVDETHAPIIGRKKKKTKPAASAEAIATPSVSKPSTPEPKAKPAKRLVELPEKKKHSEPAITLTEKEENARDAEKINQAPRGAAPPREREDGLGIAILELIAGMELGQKSLLAPFHSFPQRQPLTAVEMEDYEATRRIHLSPEAEAALLNREMIRFIGPHGSDISRVLITPRGTLLRCLSKEEEDRYVELESRLDQAEDDAWTPPEHLVEGGVDTLHGRIRQRRPLGSYELGAEFDNGQSAPLAHARTEDAFAYFNQFVSKGNESEYDLQKTAFRLMAGIPDPVYGSKEGELGYAPLPNDYTQLPWTGGSCNSANQLVAALIHGFAEELDDEDVEALYGKEALNKDMVTHMPRIPIAGVKEAEENLAKAKKESVALQKRLEILIHKNRKLAGL